MRGIDPQTQGVSLVQTAAGPSWTVGLVAAAPGRQVQHDLPSYQTPDGQVVQCHAGGFGWRYVVDSDGTVKLAGRLPVLRTTDMVVRDLPANQLMSPNACAPAQPTYESGQVHSRREVNGLHVGGDVKPRSDDEVVKDFRPVLVVEHIVHASTLEGLPLPPRSTEPMSPLTHRMNTPVRSKFTPSESTATVNDVPPKP